MRRQELCEYGPALSGICRRHEENARSEQDSSRHAGKKGCARQAVFPKNLGAFAAVSAFLPLLAAKRNDDFFIVTPEDYAAVFDRLDCNLVRLVADLQSKLLACLH